MMITLIGPSSFSGFAAIIFMGMVNYFMGKTAMQYFKKIMTTKDNRIKCTNEIFGQIKFIKVNAWEEYFYDRLNVKREEELLWIKKRF